MRAWGKIAGTTLGVLGALLAPSATAWACPACAGRNDNPTSLLWLSGVWLLPLILGALGVGAVRRIGTEAEDR